MFFNISLFFITLLFCLSSFSTLPLFTPNDGYLPSLSLFLLTSVILSLLSLSSIFFNFRFPPIPTNVPMIVFPTHSTPLLLLHLLVPPLLLHLNPSPTSSTFHSFLPHLQLPPCVKRLLLLLLMWC